MSLLPKTAILVIVGITGDLSKRKLIPALQALAKNNALPEKFHIVGVSRREITKEAIFSSDTDILSDHLSTYQMDLGSLEDYQKLQSHLEQLEKNLGGEAQWIFSLSVPPEASTGIVKLLGESGISKLPKTKLVLEKPFGTDLASAEEHVTTINNFFDENQVYRVDHYLFKKALKNIHTFRQNNPQVEGILSSQYVEKIHITATESIDIEGRAVFYEQTGALKDVLQSHLVEVAATLLGDPSESRLDVLQSLSVLPDSTVRGQYVGYREQVNNSESVIETFVSLTLSSSSPRWSGVPITLITGKALDKKVTEIELFLKDGNPLEAQKAIAHIEPSTGIELVLKSGSTELIPYPEESAPDGYEKVFLDALASQKDLFISCDEALLAWKLIEPIRQKLEEDTSNIILYKPGSSVEEVLDGTTN